MNRLLPTKEGLEGPVRAVAAVAQAWLSTGVEKVAKTAVAMTTMVMTDVATALLLRAPDTSGMGRMQGSATEKVKERR